VPTIELQARRKTNKHSLMVDTIEGIEVVYGSVIPPKQYDFPIPYGGKYDVYNPNSPFYLGTICLSCDGRTYEPDKMGFCPSCSTLNRTEKQHLPFE